MCTLVSNAVKERHAGVRQDMHQELEEVHFTLTEQCPKELDKILSEADAQGKGEVMRKLWKHDVEDRLAFKKDQAKNGTLHVCVCL